MPNVPDHPCAARTLFALVDRKQMHSCRTEPGGCRHHSATCRYGFPYAVNRAGTVFNPTTKRYEYSRFCHLDENVVPFHPPTLLAWGAHMNLQIVTGTDFSRYVLKYT